MNRTVAERVRRAKFTDMFLLIGLFLVLIWAVALAMRVLSGLIHGLLILALVMVVLHVVRARRFGRIHHRWEEHHYMQPDGWRR